MLCCPFDGTPARPRPLRLLRQLARRRVDDLPVVPHPVDGRDSVPVPPPAGERLPRLLVVDDDPSVCAFVESAMTGSFEVVSAHDAESGLALVSGSDFDAVVVDHGLPDLTGWSSSACSAATPRTLNLPVLLFTGDYSDEVEREARRAGADDYLAKPVEPQLLEERMLALVHDRAPV